MMRQVDHPSGQTEGRQGNAQAEETGTGVLGRVKGHSSRDQEGQGGTGTDLDKGHKE